MIVWVLAAACIWLFVNFLLVLGLAAGVFGRRSGWLFVVSSVVVCVVVVAIVYVQPQPFPTSSACAPFSYDIPGPGEGGGS